MRKCTRMTELDIVAFLTRCLDEDEAGALAAAEEFGPDWIEIWSGTVDLSANREDRQPADAGWETHVPTNDSRVSRFMVDHDPAHVLADIAAKRKRLALHTRHDADPHIYGAAWCEFCTHLDYDGDEDHQHIEPWPCLHLRIDAEPHADRPGYNPAWAVE